MAKSPLENISARILAKFYFSVPKISVKKAQKTLKKRKKLKKKTSKTRFITKKACKVKIKKHVSIAFL